LQTYECTISLSSSEVLKRIKGIDSKRFYALQLNNGSDLEFLLEQYVRNKYPNINNFYCTPGVIIKDNDDLVRCSFEYNDENYQIDFLFDDLSETFNHTADAGISGLRCLAAGGNYDGRQCYNLTSNDCYKLGQELEHKDKALGTIWVDDIKACILRASNALDTANTLENAALATLGIGIAVVAVPVAVAGASVALATGSTAGIIISLGELTAVSVGAVATSTSTAIQVADNFSADNINRKANECIQMRLTNADKTNGVSLEQKQHDCARNVLKYIIDNRVNWHDRAIDNNMKLSLDQSISTLIGLINPNSLNETEVTNLFDLVNIVKQNGDWHVSVKKTADVLSVLTTVAGVAIIFKGVKAAKVANEFNMANGALKLLTEKIIKLAKQPRTINGAVALTGTGIKKAYEILDTYNAASNIVQ